MPLLYIDDVVLLTMTFKKCTKSYDQFEKLLHLNKLIVNSSKTMVHIEPLGTIRNFKYVGLEVQNNHR